MDLIIFLLITNVLCSLILFVQAKEAQAVQVMAVICIVVEVIYILLAKDALSVGAADEMVKIAPCIAAVLGLICLYIMKERSVPLLIFFASLTQFFVEMGIIDAVN